MSLGSRTPEVTHRTPKAIVFNALKNKLHIDESYSTSLNVSRQESDSNSLHSVSPRVTETSKYISSTLLSGGTIDPILEEDEEEQLAIKPEKSENFSVLNDPSKNAATPTVMLFSDDQGIESGSCNGSSLILNTSKPDIDAEQQLYKSSKEIVKFLSKFSNPMYCELKKNLVENSECVSDVSSRHQNLCELSPYVLLKRIPASKHLSSSDVGRKEQIKEQQNESWHERDSSFNIFNRFNDLIADNSGKVKSLVEFSPEALYEANNNGAVEQTISCNRGMSPALEQSLTDIRVQPVSISSNDISKCSDGLQKSRLSSRKRSCAACDGSDPVSDKVGTAVDLERWTIQLLPSRELCLEGCQRGECGETFHQSGPVSKRLAADLIQTRSGQLYHLCGRLCRSVSVKTGLSKKIQHCFKNGFPEDWEELLNSAFDENSSSTGQDSEKTGRKSVSERDLTVTSLTCGKGTKDCPMSVSDLKTTRRSGRLRVPPLAWWANQRIVVDPKTLQTTIAQECENALKLPALYFGPAAEDRPVEDFNASGRKSKEVFHEDKVKLVRSANSGSSVDDSDVRGGTDLKFGKADKTKKFSKSSLSEGTMKDLPNDFSCKNSSTFSRIGGKRPKHPTKTAESDEAAFRKTSIHSKTRGHHLRKNRLEAGDKSYKRFPNSFDDVDINALGDVSKKDGKSRKMRFESGDSDFTFHNDVEPGCKKLKKQISKECNSKLSGTRGKNLVNSAWSSRHSPGHGQGTNGSVVRRRKVVSKNDCGGCMTSQESFDGKPVSRNSSSAKNPHSNSDTSETLGPKRTSQVDKRSTFDQVRDVKKGGIKQLRQKGSSELIYSKPNPSGKIVVQTRDNQRQLDQEDHLLFLEEDSLMRSMPPKPLPSKFIVSVNLSDSEDSSDVDYIFSSDEG